MLILIFITVNLLHVYYVNIASYKTLEKNKDIAIRKPDKGDGVVILDQKLYSNAIQEIISDTSKFEKLNEDPTLKREASLQRFLCKLKQKNFFNKTEYDKLYPSGSSLACIYLASFLCGLLSPFVPNDYSCKGTFSFVSQIENENLSKNVLVSYDVTSLFTNIPLQETIDIAINLIVNHTPNLNVNKKTFLFCYITDFYF